MFSILASSWSSDLCQEGGVGVGEVAWWQTAPNDLLPDEINTTVPLSRLGLGWPRLDHARYSMTAE